MIRVALAYLAGLVSGVAAAYAVLVALTSDFDDAWNVEADFRGDQSITYRITVHPDGSVTEWE